MKNIYLLILIAISANAVIIDHNDCDLALSQYGDNLIHRNYECNLVIKSMESKNTFDNNHSLKINFTRVIARKHLIYVFDELDYFVKIENTYSNLFSVEMIGNLGFGKPSISEIQVNPARGNNISCTSNCSLFLTRHQLSIYQTDCLMINVKSMGFSRINYLLKLKYHYDEYTEYPKW